MNFYSTNGKAPKVGLKEAVTKGLAPDNGLYMPERIPVMPAEFFKKSHSMSLQQIGFEVAMQFFGDDISASELKTIVYDSLNFPIPLVPVRGNIYALELFHGPTLAFKDVGARFMARLLGHFTKGMNSEINVLVATSGDTGSAVANGFYKVPGIKVYILYPKGLVTPTQEKQFVTLGENITAIEVEGKFDDCQRLVKEMFLDKEVNEKMVLTSANSINLARLIPQSFYYFYGYAQMNPGKEVICSVPSGNFGNICAGLLAKRMGLPISRFLAATNANDVFPSFLNTGDYKPRVSVQTLSNAMDVGNPSNFVRINDMYGKSVEAMRKDITGYHYSDDDTRKIIRDVFSQTRYLLEPHGAIGYKALEEYLKDKEDMQGFFIETAHPAKFTETMTEIINGPVEMPETLRKLLNGTKHTVPMKNEGKELKKYLLSKS
jgi:threonine synthase